MSATTAHPGQPDPIHKSNPIVQESSGANNRLDFIDGFRAVAALFVVLHHMWLEIWPLGHWHFAAPWIFAVTGWLFYGHFAVAAFIVISGYCLMLPITRGDGILKGGALLFLKKRARRILPPYYAALLLSIVLVKFFIGHKTGTHWDVSLPMTISGILEHAFLLQDLYHYTQINHALWSIALEWHIYLFFPLLILSSKRYGPAITVFVSFVLSYMLPPMIPLIHTLAFPYFLGLFALGMLAETITHSQQTKISKVRDGTHWTLLAATGFVAIVVACYTLGFQNPRFEIMDSMVGLESGIILIAAAQNRAGLIHRCLNWRPLVVLGGFSYSLYLVHAPLVQMVWQYVLQGKGINNMTYFSLLVAIGVPLIIAVAYLFHFVFERPFMTKPKLIPLSPGDTAK
jgi:peptidoglycan/LPS O-acetylase OafA/YrhL